MSSSDYTQLTVTNDTNEDVEVFITFGAQNSSNKCCPHPVGLSDFAFLTKVNDLMGKFTLGAKKTKEFDPNGKCFSGNVGFYIEPQCPVKGADFHHGKEGTNIAEFTLNPCSDCYEAFDISCVNGVNCFIMMKATGTDKVKGNGWTYGPDNTPIDTIYNRGLKENRGNPGVYPVNCTDCIRLIGKPPCPSLPIGPAQDKRICNVQRPGRGGVLEVILAEPVPE